MQLAICLQSCQKYHLKYNRIDLIFVSEISTVMLISQLQRKRSLQMFGRKETFVSGKINLFFYLLFLIFTPVSRTLKLQSNCIYKSIKLFFKMTIISKLRCQINDPTIIVHSIFFLLLLMCFSTLKSKLSFLEKNSIT